MITKQKNEQQMEYDFVLTMSLIIVFNLKTLKTWAEKNNNKITAGGGK